MRDKSMDQDSRDEGENHDIEDGDGNGLAYDLIEDQVEGMYS